MKRGELYYANLDPTQGAEINKKRPVLVVSRDASNRQSNTVTVLPITSNTKKVYPFEVFLPKDSSGLPKDSKAQAQQVRTIDKSRITGRPVGFLSTVTIEKVDEALRLHLAL